MQCSWAAAGSCRVCVHGGGLHAARPAAQSVSPAPTTAWLVCPSALHDRWAAGCTLSQPWTTGTPVSRSEQLAATARPLLAGTPTRTPGSSSSWLAGPVTAVRVFWRHGWQADSAPVVCPPSSIPMGARVACPVPGLCCRARRQPPSCRHLSAGPTTPPVPTARGALHAAAAHRKKTMQLRIPRRASRHAMPSGDDHGHGRRLGGSVAQCRRRSHGCRACPLHCPHHSTLLYSTLPSSWSAAGV